MHVDVDAPISLTGCGCVCAQVCTHPPARTRTPARTHTHTRARAHTHARARTHSLMHARTHAHTLAHTLTKLDADGGRCGVCASAFHRRFTPLHRAGFHGHATVAAALLTHGADVNAKSNYGCGSRSLFRATVGVRCAAVDRDGTDNKIAARRSGCMHTHIYTQTHDGLPSRTHAHSPSRCHTSTKRVRTHIHTNAPSHPHDRTKTHSH